MTEQERVCSCGEGLERSCEGGCACIRWEDGTTESWCAGTVPAYGSYRGPNSATLTLWARNIPLGDLAAAFDLMVPEKVSSPPGEFSRRVTLTIEQKSLKEVIEQLGFTRT